MNKSYLTIAMAWTAGLILAAALIFGIVTMVVIGSLRQADIQVARDCEWAKDKTFAEDWYIKNCVK